MTGTGRPPILSGTQRAYPISVRVNASRPFLFLRIPVIFFFQAEDGIRAYKVTGVQTCALPISARSEVVEAGGRRKRCDQADDSAARAAGNAAIRPTTARRERPETLRSGRRQRGERCRTRVAQKLPGPRGLVAFADRRRGGSEQVEGAEEAAVGLMLPRNRAVAPPASATQLVEPAVIPRPGV